MSLPRLGQAGWSLMPSRILCLIPRCGGCASHNLTREHGVIIDEANRGTRKGQSVCSDPPNKGFAFDVGLLVGGPVVLDSAVRAGDGIPWPAARAGEPANPCLHRM